jgi:asparagine synthase (glutamine-hydrolysing)
MCGIVGQIAFDSQVDHHRMSKALDSLQHRGPDAEGSWSNPAGNVWLGHRRLSILDLSNAGAQPMMREDGGLVIVFNGEIYNFKEIREELIGKGYAFKSSSDTEVLLHAWHCWGENSLEKINGMFAFAMYDTKSGALTLVRDRIGEKPLYYFIDAGGIIFASELKAICEAYPGQLEVDPAAVNCLLGMGYVPGTMSMVKGISKLTPGHYVVLERGCSGKALLEIPFL